MQVTFYPQNNNLDIDTYSLGGVMIYLTRIPICFLRQDLTTQTTLF